MKTGKISIDRICELNKTPNISINYKFVTHEFSFYNKKDVKNLLFLFRNSVFFLEKELESLKNNT